MRSVLILTVLFCCLITTAYSQKQIIVQKGDNVKLYKVTELQKAFDEAESGSDVYLPGYDWVNGSSFYRLNKKLNIYGAGTYSTDQVVDFMSLVIDPGCDSSIIEGIKMYLTSNFNIVGNVSNINFNKCRIVAISLGTSGADSTTNIKFKDCIFQWYGGAIYNTSKKTRNINFTNCIFNSLTSTSIISNSYNANFINCIFHTQGLFGDNNSSNNRFENCIFLNTSSLSNTGKLNSFINCMTIFNQSNWGSENYAENNLVNQHKDSIFANPLTITQFSETFDYQLKSTSPGKNYGTDGNDLGIYGGSSPYKDNAIPIIPYIKTFNPAKKTVEGKLEISVDVESQTR